MVYSKQGISKLNHQLFELMICELAFEISPLGLGTSFISLEHLKFGGLDQKV